MACLERFHDHINHGTNCFGVGSPTDPPLIRDSPDASFHPVLAVPRSRALVDGRARDDRNQLLFGSRQLWVPPGFA